MRDWAGQLAGKKPDGKKQPEPLPGSVADVFAGALGYSRAPADDRLPWEGDHGEGAAKPAA